LETGLTLGVFSPEPTTLDQTKTDPIPTVKALPETRCTKNAQSFVPKFGVLVMALITAVAGMVALTGCDDESTVLAPYLGSRPLTILRVTQSAKPDIQWPTFQPPISPF